MRQNMKAEMHQFAMQTTATEEFIKKRKVPIGSNWSGKTPNEPPRPAVVAIRRLDAQPISNMMITKIKKTRDK